MHTNSDNFHGREIFIKQILDFLNRPSPTFADYDAWKDECLSFGKEAIRVFIDTLSSGSKDGDVQEKALQCLRLYGVEAFDNGDYGKPSFAYLVRQPGHTEWTEIKPAVIPEDFTKVALKFFEEDIARITQEERRRQGIE